MGESPTESNVLPSGDIDARGPISAPGIRRMDTSTHNDSRGQSSAEVQPPSALSVGCAPDGEIIEPDRTIIVADTSSGLDTGFV